MTQFPELFTALSARFTPEEVRLKPGGKGRPEVKFVTARTVMNRFDTVLGPENWWDDYRPAGEHSTLCVLSIRLPDGSVLTKCDAGGAAGMADLGDDEKSAVSDAFKRAAVKFGVGRYLYRDGVASFPKRIARPIAVPGLSAEGPWVPGTATELGDWLRAQADSFDIEPTTELRRWADKGGYPAEMESWTAHQLGQAHLKAESIVKRQLEARRKAQESVA